MCGICGIYGQENKILIQKMLDVLKHRGPDGQGIFSDKNITLGHSRLSIIDLSEHGKQPMSNEEGDIWLSVNGEIYNFKELRAQLEKRGHHFHSNSDSETIIHAYEEFDLEFIKKLRGMFALAIYDRKKELLILARDPIGKKPLYYANYQGCFLFASEIKALLEAGFPRILDKTAFWSYLAYQYPLGEKTLFQGVQKLLPGHMLILNEKEVIIHKYWDIVENVINENEDYFAKKLLEILENATKLRMNSDVPVGAFLSGGIDSSAVVALARPYYTNNFHTFSVGFETFSELPYAKKVSEYLDTDHHEVQITSEMVLKDLRKIAWIYDEPLGDAAIINTYFLSKEAKKYVTVVLTGDGGDELFGGYLNYSYNPRIYSLLRNPVISKMAGAVTNLFYKRYYPFNSHFINNKMRYLDFFLDSSFDRIHLNTQRNLGDKEIENISSLPYVDINTHANFPEAQQTSLGKMLAVDCKNLLPEKFLMKVDKGTMANSVEARIPLLDVELIQFAFTIPPQLKIKNRQEKYILRKAVQGLLPREILQRPKLGFGTTVGQWMQDDLQEIVLQMIHEGPLLKDTLKNDARLHLIKNLNKKIRYSPSEIWTLFAAELWYDCYFRGC
ncbi:MAG: asparagine synthase (glutamine-hydrolyzing) [Methanoregula sp.]|nr:asparagine synthase (glutamine-hydrolyzing) [Methanoregula sp.]